MAAAAVVEGTANERIHRRKPRFSPGKNTGSFQSFQNALINLIFRQENFSRFALLPDLKFRIRKHIQTRVREYTATV